MLGIGIFELIRSNSPPCYLTISGQIVTSLTKRCLQEWRLDNLSQVTFVLDGMSLKRSQCLFVQFLRHTYWDISDLWMTFIDLWQNVYNSQESSRRYMKLPLFGPRGSRWILNSSERTQDSALRLGNTTHWNLGREEKPCSADGNVQISEQLPCQNVSSRMGGAVAEWVRALDWTDDRTVPVGFESHCGKLRFTTLANLFTPLCQCLSEETLKAVGPFYLVSMPGEVKYPTSRHWNVYNTGMIYLQTVEAAAVSRDWWIIDAL